VQCGAVSVMLEPTMMWREPLNVVMTS